LGQPPVEDWVLEARIYKGSASPINLSDFV